MSQEKVFTEWKERESIAESMIPMVGRMYRERNVEISVYGQVIVNRAVIDIIKAHRFVRQITGAELSVVNTFPILQLVDQLGVTNSHVDIGKLFELFNTKSHGLSLEEFVAEELNDAPRNGKEEKATDVVLYGFGRIGRLLARLLIEKTGGGQAMRLRAIVVRKGSKDDLAKRASLLRRDSVHGAFRGTITIDEEANTITANGNVIQVIYADAPDNIDYTEYGISHALVVDNTGKWRDEDGLSLHLRANGVARVLLTAPGKGDLKNIVMGVNHGDIVDTDKILSAASCTTNAIVPVLKAINDEFGVEYGHVETVHSYTNDQNLIDNYHKADRRGRAAPLNMVITETGAAKAVSKALPELTGKLTGNAIRVPTPNVSMAILNLTLEQEVTKDELNDYLNWVSLHSSMQKQVGYSNSPEAVSSDFTGTRSAGIVDGLATIVSGKRCVLYVWYDNEFGYSCQVVRIMQYLTGSTLSVFPVE
ncbi:glyceraldehyde-3-phosphate dehydrogenase [Pokkaliibacter sp. MBI-7]|uniref:glyceraldehyde-3-phosphate dehydrogenase n=1 Tax=Pokkaliibacter sp. MBI-7 TaxID=3040600 RepID=UPI00244AF235|nr:glyceraldehyde-3-phosphate dehydrogenase [Pokkaliibacter sp. MBI-7]MDH2431141.1 glyceraldehyde-3-phosphate dehydrogenase [Pokkaliibacter sp. MBI-7]